MRILRVSLTIPGARTPRTTAAPTTAGTAFRQFVVVVIEAADVVFA